jgi:hypothetical protein
MKISLELINISYNEGDRRIYNTITDNYSFHLFDSIITYKYIKNNTNYYINKFIFNYYEECIYDILCSESVFINFNFYQLC